MLVVHHISNPMWLSVFDCGICEPTPEEVSTDKWGTFDWSEVTCGKCLAVKSNDGDENSNDKK